VRKLSGRNVGAVAEPHLRQRHARGLVQRLSAAAGRIKAELVPERPARRRDIFQRREPGRIEVIWNEARGRARASMIGTW